MKALIPLAIALAAACTPPPPQGKPGVLVFGAATHSLGEAGGTLSIPVKRTLARDGEVSVTCGIQGGSASVGADYTLPAATVSWGDQEDSDKACSLQILDDGLVEGEETVILELQSATGGATLGAPATTSVSLLDDDANVPGNLRFALGSFPVLESAGSVEVRVSRRGGALGTVSVRYQFFSGSATPDVDFTSLSSGTLTWGEGDVADKTFLIPILDDTERENHETISMNLAAPTGGATLVTPYNASVTIQNDDSTVQVYEAAVRLGENDTSGVGFYLHNTGMLPNDATVTYSTVSGTAQAGSDFVNLSGTFTFPKNSTSGSWLYVPLLDDALVEGDEAFTISLSSPTGGVTLGAPSQIAVTMADDEAPPAGTLELASPRFKASNYGGQVTITVNRVGGSTGGVAVDYGVRDGNATAGADFTAVSGTLAWADGDSSPKTFAIPIVDDTEVESADWFWVELKNPQGGAFHGLPADVYISELFDKEPYQPLLQPSASGNWDSAAVTAPSVLALAPSSYLMFYQGGGGASGIGRATSTDGIAWTRSPTTPVFTAGAAGKFDEGSVDNPSVLFDGATYHLWYDNAGASSSGGRAIGYATSPDGISWTRQNSGNPVLVKGSTFNAWDYDGVFQPSVIQDGATFKMWFTAAGNSRLQIGYATSPDGITWTKHPSNPVLTQNPTGWDWNQVEAPSVLKDGSVYRMWYQGRNPYPRVGYASSSDGVTWSRYPNPVIAINGNYWDEYAVTSPSAVNEGDGFTVWYAGSGGTAVQPSIGRAINPDNN